MCIRRRPSRGTAGGFKSGGARRIRGFAIGYVAVHAGTGPLPEDQRGVLTGMEIFIVDFAVWYRQAASVTVLRN